MSKQNLEFKTEVKQLLDLMIHSLYSHKEIFLRELISNASDAIDKARYEALTNPHLHEEDKDWKIEIKSDKEAKTLTVSDNGIGMVMDEVIKQLGTIAHSGTKEFLSAIQSKEIKDNPELIGQFGVGFYSSFMVADRVVVLTRKAGTDYNLGVRWESTSDGTYTIEEYEKKTKGTDVILYIKDEEKKYLDEWEIRTIIKKYSDYIAHPIVMEVERERPIDDPQNDADKEKRIKVKETETLNMMKAIWLRNKSEIEENEYNEFYKHVSHDFTDPSKVIHYKAEGTNEFNALLFIPSHAPFNILFKDFKIGPSLYVNRVQIMENCEDLIPIYLRFIKGVVDSKDLPLNVSRELLQKNRQIEVIKKNISKKILDTFKEMLENDYDKYLAFYKEFGHIVKEGLHHDHAKRETIAELLLFSSLKTPEGQYITLQKYIDNMPIKQKGNIYFITSPSISSALTSPYIEAFKEQDFDVLVLTDEIDSFVFDHFTYKDKTFKSVVKGDIELDESKKAEKTKEQAHFKDLFDVLKEHLKDDVSEVRASGRLKDSPCCLVAAEHAMEPSMEKILKSMGQEIPDNKRILEINPTHPIVTSMQNIFEKDKESQGGTHKEMLKQYSLLLYNQALLLEGSTLKDPSGFAKAVTQLMVDNIKSS
ncbi:MAG: molecular chaperone HtpG [Nitrospirae bacterium]|nr:molecular chaperone HtpG [Nitrospirota bacterium]